MARQYLVEMVLPSATGIPKDDVVNDWVWEMPDAWDPVANHGDITLPTFAIYNTTPTSQPHAIGWYISGQISRSTNMQAKVYEITGHLDGSPHGSPVAIDTGTLVAEGSGAYDMPSEVAAVLTLRGLGFDTALVEGPTATLPTDARAQRLGAPATHTGKTRPRQRHSGRIYFGPLNTNVIDVVTFGGHRPRISSEFRAVCTQAVKDNYLSASGGAGRLKVWSRRLVDVRSVVQVEMDDAFDVQRRRGISASARTVLAV